LNRFFSIAGPVKTDRHYHIDPLSRVDWDEVQLLFAQQEYLVIHAPRQTGKTSTMLSMMEKLNESGE
jgi:hypothetical protein